MTINTRCLSESKYLLEHAMRTRGLTPNITEHTFRIVEPYIKWSLSFMPGNRRTLISHEVNIESAFRGKGLGRKMLNLREELAKEAGCNLILATVKNDNAIEIHLLETSGWTRFTNREETMTSLWGKQLG